MNRAPSSKPFSWLGVFAVILVSCVALGSAGCEEFGARRKIQEGGKLYEKGNFAEAAKLYEEAVASQPHLVIGHYNAGLAYRQLFLMEQAHPDSKEEDIKAAANKAAEHFLVYLEAEPDDSQIVNIMTKVWLDSSQFDKALAYWEGRRAKEPDSSDVLSILASIYRQSGNWEKAVEYHLHQSEVQPTNDGKAKVVVDIAKIIWHQLADRQKLIGAERVRVADLGLGTLQKAGALSDLHTQTKVEIESYIMSFYNFRAMAHGASWAREADNASAQYHRTQWSALREELKKEQEAEQGLAPAGSEGSEG
jgi:tetratricopeptide (TPR) repeat protein